METLCALQILLFASLVTLAFSQGTGPYDNLTASLFEKYNQHYAPTHHNATRVDMGLELHSITKLDEFTGTFTAVIWQTLTWKDSRLSWDASKHNGIDVLRIPASHIWIPDIILYNSVAEWQVQGHVHALAYPDGTLYYVVPLVINTSCQMSLGKFPYDVQQCSLVWGSWVHDASKVALHPQAEQFGLSFFISNPTWKVVDTSLVKTVKYYVGVPEAYEDVTATVVLRRHHPDGLIATAVITTWMILVVFVLGPPSSGERIILACFIFVSLVVISVWVSTLVPAYTMTSLGRFLVFGLIMTAIITVFLSLSFTFYPRQEPAPSKEPDVPGDTQDLIRMRRRRYFRLVDIGAMIVTGVLLAIMTGALFSS